MRVITSFTTTTQTYLGDEVDDIILGADLHGHGEVTGGIRWEEHVDRALLEPAITCRATNLEDVELYRGGHELTASISTS